VDATGRPKKAKNQWSKARAAIALNLPRLKLMGLWVALLLGFGIVFLLLVGAVNAANLTAEIGDVDIRGIHSETSEERRAE
jgi:hypothetical protein